MADSDTTLTATIIAKFEGADQVKAGADKVTASIDQIKKAGAGGGSGFGVTTRGSLAAGVGAPVAVTLVNPQGQAISGPGTAAREGLTVQQRVIPGAVAALGAAAVSGQATEEPFILRRLAQFFGVTPSGRAHTPLAEVPALSEEKQLQLSLPGFYENYKTKPGEPVPTGRVAFGKQVYRDPKTGRIVASPPSSAFTKEPELPLGEAAESTAPELSGTVKVASEIAGSSVAAAAPVKNLDQSLRSIAGAGHQASSGLAESSSSLRNFRETLHLVELPLRSAGVPLLGLARLSYAASAGFGLLGAALGAAAIVSGIKRIYDYDQNIRVAQEHLAEFTGSAETSDRVWKVLSDGAARAGGSVEKLTPAYEDLSDAVDKYNVHQKAIGEQQKTANPEEYAKSVDTLKNAFLGLGLGEEGATKFFSGFDKAGKLTIEQLENLRKTAPSVANDLAKQLGYDTYADLREAVSGGLTISAPETVRAFAPLQQTYEQRAEQRVPESVGEFFTQLWRSITPAAPAFQTGQDRQTAPSGFLSYPRYLPQLINAGRRGVDELANLPTQGLDWLFPLKKGADDAAVSLEKVQAAAEKAAEGRAASLQEKEAAEKFGKTLETPKEALETFGKVLSAAKAKLDAEYIEPETAQKLEHDKQAIESTKLQEQKLQFDKEELSLKPQSLALSKEGSALSLRAAAREEEQARAEGPKRGESQEAYEDRLEGLQIKQYEALQAIQHADLEERKLPLENEQLAQQQRGLQTRLTDETLKFNKDNAGQLIDVQTSQLEANSKMVDLLQEIVNNTATKEREPGFGLTPEDVDKRLQGINQENPLFKLALKSIETELPNLGQAADEATPAINSLAKAISELTGAAGESPGGSPGSSPISPSGTRILNGGVGAGVIPAGLAASLSGRSSPARPTYGGVDLSSLPPNAQQAVRSRQSEIAGSPQGYQIVRTPDDIYRVIPSGPIPQGLTPVGPAPPGVIPTPGPQFGPLAGVTGPVGGGPSYDRDDQGNLVIQQQRDGGPIIFRGPGTGTSDSILTMLEPGGFVLKAAATQKLLRGMQDGGQIPAMVSTGEAYFDPEDVGNVPGGVDTLNTLNAMGGGPIRLQGGGDALSAPGEKIHVNDPQGLRRKLGRRGIKTGLQLLSVLGQLPGGGGLLGDYGHLAEGGPATDDMSKLWQAFVGSNKVNPATFLGTPGIGLGPPWQSGDKDRRESGWALGGLLKLAGGGFSAAPGGQGGGFSGSGATFPGGFFASSIGDLPGGLSTLSGYNLGPYGSHAPFGFHTAISDGFQQTFGQGATSPFLGRAEGGPISVDMPSFDMPRYSLPAFQGGGAVDATASPSGKTPPVTGGTPIHLHIGDRTYEMMARDEDADDLVRYSDARKQQQAQGTNRPSWYYSS